MKFIIPKGISNANLRVFAKPQWSFKVAKINFVGEASEERGAKIQTCVKLFLEPKINEDQVQK